MLKYGISSNRFSNYGGAKIWIVIIVAVLSLLIYVIMVYAPIYQTTWDVEDRMRMHMLRLVRTGEDTMFEHLQDWLDKNKIDIQVYEDCTFQGTPGHHGKFVCNYEVPVVMFGGRYKRVDKFPIVVEMKHIPESDVY